jgi:hypothetical protein
MNISDWNKSHNAHHMLTHMKESNHPAFLNDAKLIKKYLLKCCQKYNKFEPSTGTFLCLNAAGKFINGQMKEKEFYSFVWSSEGKAFGVEHQAFGVFGNIFLYDSAYSKSFKLVKIGKGCSAKEAKTFMVGLAYFINSVMDYCYHTGNDIPSLDYHSFFSPSLLRQTFHFTEKS